VAQTIKTAEEVIVGKEIDISGVRKPCLTADRRKGMDKERLERRLTEAIERGEISEQEARQIYREAEAEEHDDDI